MQAFHNSLEIKNKYLNRVMAHAAADRLVQGVMWQNGKGCAIGCTLEAYDHKKYETELGIPQWLARVEDRIFEGLPKEKAMEWPTKFLAAVHPGADLNKIKAPFLIFVLESTLDKFDHAKYPNIKKSIDDVIAFYKRGDATPEEFKTARAAYAAYAAYADAAAAAADAAAYAAADAAYADAAAYAAYAAYAYAYAYADADAAAAADARYAAYERFADKLLEIIGNCK